MSPSVTAPTILVVCTGNVCRSPYLERRLQAGLDESWGPGEVDVRSAGTGALVGSAMDPASAALLRAHGVDPDAFQARALTKQLVADAALVITATRAHRTAVTRLAPRALRTTHAALDLAHVVASVRLPPVENITPTGWFSEVVPALAAARGRQTPLPAEEADIVDPYRRGPEVFDAMARQIDAALPALLRVLGRPER